MIYGEKSIYLNDSFRNQYYKKDLLGGKFCIFTPDDKEFKGDIYYLYEYSDNIQLISDNPQYPSMLNYIKTGLLTEEEMIQALLHE